MKEKLLSIIVPIYNSEQYLQYCLESIKNQTYRNFECLMIDDGSSDNSSNICTEYKTKDARFKYFRTNQSGVACARNFGLSHACGEYIAFADNDDLLHPKMYEILILNLEEKNCDVSCCTYEKEYDTYDVIREGFSKYIFDPEIIVISGTNDIYDSIVRGKDNKAIEGLIWNKVYKQSIIGNLKFNEKIQLVDDADFSLRLFRKVKQVCYVDAAFYHWMQHTTNQTKTGGYAKCASAAHAYEDMIGYVSNFVTNQKIIDTLKEQSLIWNLSALNKCITQKDITNDEIWYYVSVIKKYHHFTKNYPWKEKIKIAMLEKTMPIYRLWYINTRR